VTRPTALEVRINSIPEALRLERRWVLWRYKWDGLRWTKLPYQFTGWLAKSDDPTTWCSFDQARSALQTERFDGIGFMLGDGWAGIDLDQCVSDYNPKTGSLFASTDAVGPFILALDQSNVYWELSPSGTGYKAIGRSERVGGEIKFSTSPPTFTTWSRPRFFTVTGHYQSASDVPVDITELIDHWFPAAVVDMPPGREGYSLAAAMTDEQLLMQMIGGDINSEEIFALWRGETAPYGDDRSRADLALCCHLAFWTNFDAERIDRLFRQSGLYRPKWDQASYRRATIGKALR